MLEGCLYSVEIHICLLCLFFISFLPGEAIYSYLAWPLKAIWFLQNLVLSGAVLITLVYWGWAIYEGEVYKLVTISTSWHRLL